MTNHPPCSAWAEKLALRREDLSSTQRDALDTHLERCHVCRQAQIDYHFLDIALRALPQPAVKPFPRLSLPLETGRPELKVAAWQRASHKISALTWQPVFHIKSGKAPTFIVVCLFLLSVGIYGLLNPFNAAHSSGIALLTYQQHTGFIGAVAWSPDSKYIATGSWDNTVQVWDAKTGKATITYKGHEDLVDALAWSPHGQYVASASWDGTVQIWDAKTGKTITKYKGHGNAFVSTVAWSPDGQEIASGSWDHTVQVWKPFNGQNIATYVDPEHSDFVNTLAWSPDSKYIVSGERNGKIIIWDAQTGALHLDQYYAIGYPVDAVAWSPNGNKIAIGGDAKFVQILDAGSGYPLLTYTGHSKEVDALTWSPDSKYVASGSWDHTAQIWNAKNGTTMLIYKGHSDIVDAVAWSHDGKKIVSGSWDRTAQVWAPET